MGYRWLLSVALTACVHDLPATPTAPITPTDPASTGESVVEHSYAVNFVPFGAGQFQNGQRRKAVGFAIAEGVTGATSLGIFVYLYRRYGIGGTVPIDEANDVRTLQRIQVGSGLGFFGLYAVGVVDAIVHFTPRVRSRNPITLGPMRVAHGAGLSLAWLR